MKKHTVQEGEWLKEIALQYGFPNWQKVWEHASNADLVTLRGEPDLLFAGDVINIPEPESNAVSAASDSTHKFVKKCLKMNLKIKVEDEEGEPLASKPWTIEIEGKTYTGNTDAEGLVEQELPVSKGIGKLSVDKHVFPVQLGHMDPLDEIVGIQKRLHNIGYDCGALDGEMGPKTEAALQLFQFDNELSKTGTADQPTKSKLKELYGC